MAALCLTLYSLLELHPHIRIEDVRGEGRLIRVQLSGKLSHGYESELERAVLSSLKSGQQILPVEMESKGAVERFKSIAQPYFADLCRGSSTTCGLKIKNFYMPTPERSEDAPEPELPAYLALISDGEALFICSGANKGELSDAKKRALKYDSLHHLALGKELVSCIEGIACYTPRGARIKQAAKNKVLNMALGRGFEPYAAREPSVAWKFIDALEPAKAYAQLEVVSSNGSGQDLFSLRREGVLSIRGVGSKDLLKAHLTSSLQLIADILKIEGEIDVCSQALGAGMKNETNELTAMSGLLQSVPLAKWRLEGKKFELFFFLDRWIGVLIEIDKSGAANCLMREGCFEN